MTDDPRTADLARQIVGQIGHVSARAYAAAVQAMFDGKPEVAKRWLGYMSRTDLQIFAMRARLASEMATDRIAVMDRDSADYVQPDPDYPGMDEPGDAA